MKLSRPSKGHTEVYTASLNDIMFFLLLFFLIVSTLVNPSVIKLLLPKAASNEQTVSKQSINLTITQDKQYFINDVPVSFEGIEPRLASLVGDIEKTTVILRADKGLQLQDVVDVLDIGSKLKLKIILATSRD